MMAMPKAAAEGDAPAIKPFESLNEEILSLIQRNMAEQRFGPGERLITQGEPGSSLMVLTEGEAEVSVEAGGQSHMLNRVGPGEVLGEMALLTKGPRMASITAVTPVVARVMTAERFDALAAGDPRISTLLTLLLASRLGGARHDAMTGSTLHGYRIRRCVGTGGMSVVYEAEDASGRGVALKMMSHKLLYEPTARAQFQHEADIVESFDHPNIARLYGRFEAFRTYFLVMELCEGVSIQAALKAGEPLSEPLARRVLGQTALAIAHAHGHGVIHRDIKPGNIMVTHGGVVKLIDFGLAGELDKECLSLAFFGTPHYMAPEQMACGAVGKAADLFALGHVAYEMVTNQPLFDAETFSQLRDQVIRCELPDFGKDPRIGPELRMILEGLLRRDPDQRVLDLDRLRSWAEPVHDPRFAR